MRRVAPQNDIIHTHSCHLLTNATRTHDEKLGLLHLLEQLLTLRRIVAHGSFSGRRHPQSKPIVLRHGMVWCVTVVPPEGDGYGLDGVYIFVRTTDSQRSWKARISNHARCPKCKRGGGPGGGLNAGDCCCCGIFIQTRLSVAPQQPSWCFKIQTKEYRGGTVLIVQVVLRDARIEGIQNNTGKFQHDESVALQVDWRGLHYYYLTTTTVIGL